MNGESFAAAPAIKECPGAAKAGRILQGERAATGNVTLPLIVKSVKLPVELTRMLPVLLIVPPKVATEALLAMNAPLLVTSLRVAVPRLRITPLPKVVSVPPLMVAPPVNWTSEPSSCLDEAPAIVEVAPAFPVKRSNPPALACMMPVFVRPEVALGSTSRKRPATLALIKPPLRLTIPSSFVPRLPELLVSPWMVKVSPLLPPLKSVPVPRTRAAFCRVRVLPVKVTLPLMVRSVKLPVELIRIEPVLLIVPPRVVTEALLAMNLHRCWLRRLGWRCQGCE